MGLFPKLVVVIGLLELSSGQGQQFTRSGKLCVENNGNQGVCEQQIAQILEIKHKGYWWCYIGYDSREWETCTESSSTEFRCSSGGVTRHGDCSNTNCCSDSGWCGNTSDFCNCGNCLNYRDEACTEQRCDANSDCVWNNDDKTASCKCKYGYYKGYDDSGCHNCTEDSHCDDDKQCKDNSCVNPCNNYCSANATCVVSNHQSVCFCPEGYTVIEKTACESAHSSTDILIYSSSAGALIVLILAIFGTVYCCKLKKKQNSKTVKKENYFEAETQFGTEVVQQNQENGRTDAIEHTYEDPEQMNNMRDMLRESHGHTYENPDILPNIRNITMQPPDGAYVYPDQF